jgi:uncharacterized membrane protein YheB (UPF0754 family)
MKHLRVEDIEHMVKEELSRPEVRSMINDRLSEYMKEREFEDKIKSIISDTFENYFKYMYTKRGMWKNELKK